MHRYDWQSEARFLFILVVIAGLIGLLIDQLAWCLVIVCAGYIVWLWRQIYRMQNWLAGGLKGEPPESMGAWGTIFADVYQLHVKGKKEHSRMRSLARRIRNSFAALNDAVVMLDKKGNIEWSNIAARRYLGLRYPQDVGHPVLHFLREPAFKRYYEQERYDGYYEAPSPVNSELHLQYQITFFGKRSRVLFARDITATYLMDQTRKDFVANASHEMRTPLTVINGYLQTFSDHDNGDNPRWTRAVQQMLEQTRRMEALVRDLITLSQLESMPDLVQIERIDVDKLLAKLREEALAAVDGARTITLESAGGTLLGQEKEIHSAFSNLIINAAKYTEEGGHIDISWKLTEEGACFAVKDDGIGIDTHDLPRLTERFYRVDKSRSINTGGTGLGLAIVKHVLMRYDAQLKITSRLGEGSCFTCVFPLHCVEQDGAILKEKQKNQELS